MSARSRERIMKAGMQVLIEDGAGATVGTIARRAGLSEVTFFSCFSSKDDLVAHLRFRRVQSHVAIATAYARLDATPIERLEGFVWAAAEDMAPHRAYIEVADQLGVFDDASLRAIERLMSVVGRMVAHAVEEGSARPGLTATDVMNTVMVSTLAAALHAPAQPAHWQRFVALAVPGLRATAGPALPGAAPTADDLVAQRTVRRDQAEAS
jgi:AcrR family transcriptional regulator